MKLIFAKTKKMRIICAILSAIMLTLAVFAGYFAIGNLLCASDGPILVSDTANAFFLGYYLLAGAYFTCCVLAVIFSVIFALNAVRAFRK